MTLSSDRQPITAVQELKRGHPRFSELANPPDRGVKLIYPAKENEQKRTENAQTKRKRANTRKSKQIAPQHD
jgi:hypothetical protein